MRIRQGTKAELLTSFSNSAFDWRNPSASVFKTLYLSWSDVC